MALMGRGGELDLGRAPVRKRKARARSRAAVRGRFQVELLETRVLLFGDPLAGQMPLITPLVLAPPAVVSYAVPEVPNADLATAVFPAANGQPSDFGPALIEPAHLAFLATPQLFDGPIALDSGAPVASGGPRLLSAVAGESSYQVAGPAPFRAIERGDGLSQVTAGSISDSAIGDSSPVTSLAHEFQGGFGPTGLGLVLISAPDPGYGTDGFVQTDPYRETFAGILDEAHPFSTMEFTIDAPNEPLAFALHSADAGGVVAAFGSMRLFNPDGSPFAEFDPEYGSPGATSQTFNFPMRDAPVGGRVIVQIVPSESSTANVAGTTDVAAATTANWSVPFVLTVQRQDDESQSVSSGLPAQGTIAVGTLAFSAIAPSGMPSGPDSPATAPATQVVDASLSNQEATPPVIAAADASASEPADGFNLRVPTGPFVSRNAGPLGPILASVGGDPTPEVDRNERALFQEIDRRDVDQGFDQSGRRLELAEGEPSESQVEELSGRVVDVTGAGGLSFKVTGLASGRRTNLSNLLAAIPSRAGAEQQGHGPAETAHSIDPFADAVIAEAPAGALAPGYADLIKAACGLALGLGMSSRAVFPNLLASIRRRVPRLKRKRQAGSGSTVN